MILGAAKYYPVAQAFLKNATSGEIEEGIGPTATPDLELEHRSELFFQEDFETLEGWNVNPRGGRVWADGQLHLEAPEGHTFPVVEKREGIFPPEGDFEFHTKVDFPEKTGYGVYFLLVDENDNPILDVNGWECAHPFVQVVLNNGEEKNSFIIFSENGWDGSLGNPDIPHSFSFYYSDEGAGYLAVDNTYIAQLSSLPRPVGIKMGNPETVTHLGAWTKMGVDFLEVR